MPGAKYEQLAVKADCEEDVFTSKGRGKWPDICLQKSLLSLCLILLYFSLSIGLTFYQRWLLKDFHYPLTVVMYHLIIKWLLSVVVRFVLSLATGTPQLLLPFMTCVTSVAPTGLASGIDVGFSNWGLELVTISLYTMTKSTTIIFILGFAILLGLEKKSWSLVFIVLMISTGLVMFTYKATQFNLLGFNFLLIASFASGLRWTFAQLLMQKSKLGLHNPVDMVFHVQPWMFISLLPFTVMFEGLDCFDYLFGLPTQDMTPTLLKVSVGATIAFAMEISEFLVVTYTSSLTLSIAGIFKEMCILVLAVEVSGDQLSGVNVAGLGVCLLGIISHMVHKILIIREYVGKVKAIDEDDFDNISRKRAPTPEGEHDAPLLEDERWPSEDSDADGNTVLFEIMQRRDGRDKIKKWFVTKPKMGLNPGPVASTSANGDHADCLKMKAADEVAVTKPLESAFAEEGSRLCLHCSFGLRNSQYLYVAWKIGIYTVERSSSDFEVITRGGDFILHIKSVQLDMAGKVVCEVRKALPNRKYTSIAKSNACITVLPKNGSHESNDRTNTAFKSKVYEETPSDSRNSSQADSFNKCVTNNNRYSSANGRRISRCFDSVQQKNSTMEIIYCRLEEKRFHFLDTRYVGDEESELSPSVRLSAAEDQSSIKLNWSRSIDSHSWYAIDLVQANGAPMEVGVSSYPELEVRCPPPGHVVRVRVRRVDAVDDGAEYNVSISPSIERQSLSKCEVIKPKSLFEECYQKLSSEVLGYGAFGSVYLVQDGKGNCFAAKVIKTRTQKKRESARREYEVMRKLDHPKLVALFDAYCAVDTFILVMEYLWGGELLERVAEEEHFKEIDAVTYVRQICEALQYLHNLNIVHLDLKPENIVCISPNSNQIKLIDFGIAKILQDGQVVKAIYGTRDYIAPEVLNYEPLTTACDMWSFGVVTYVLLSGVIPFPGMTWAERCANITKANYNFDEEAFDEISSRAKDFIKALLQKKPCTRLTAEEALNHCWLVEGPATPAIPIKLTTINLKTYVATIRTRWQRAANVMIAANRLRCFQLRAPLS